MKRRGVASFSIEPIGRLPSCAGLLRMRKLLLIQSMLPILLVGADLTIDHVTVAGARLKDLQSALSAVGIAADYGGSHGNRATEMAIASFPDGSYLELI